MTTFASRSWDYIRRLVRGADVDRPETGTVTIRDGLSAVVELEAMLSESAGLGTTFPAAHAARAWSRLVLEGRTNLFGRRLGAVPGDGPRAALAATIGTSMAGERSTTFLSGTDLLSVQDLLGIAAGRHVPIVMHVACRAAPGHGQAIGSGHESIHGASDAGWFQLFAMNANEAVDLALIARRVAETTLVPGMVVMDGEQTALSAQDVMLPSAEAIRVIAGDPETPIAPATDAQRILHGASRRRVPRVFSVDRPALALPCHGTDTFALGAAGRRPYFAAAVPGALDEAIDAVAANTGRRLDPLLRVGAKRARTVLVAQGAAAETVCAFAEHVAGTGASVAAVAVRMLRPFPAERLAELCGGARTVAVLERVDVPLAAAGPLAREVAHALSAGKDAPRIVTVPFGLGGLPLNAADLAALPAALDERRQPVCYLGLDFLRDTSVFPKQQALMDTLRRSDPGLATLAVRGTEPAPDLRPDGGLTVQVHRRPGRQDENFAAEAVAVLHESFGGAVRSRPAATWDREDGMCADRLVLAPERLRDPGDDVPVDIAVLAGDRFDERDRCDGLVEGAAVLVAAFAGSTPEAQTIPPRLGEALSRAGAEFRYVDVVDHAGIDPRTARREALLGGLLRLAHDRRGDEPLAAKTARALREACLEPGPADEAIARLDAFVGGFESLRTFAPAFAAAPQPTAGHDDAARPKATAQPSAALVEAWSHTGIFHGTGRTAELTAHPHLAEGSLAPASSTLRTPGAAAAFLPVFDPATCDGDPGLWTTCPDGSVLPIVIPASALIDRGIQLAGERGRPADALRSIAGGLARRMNKLLAASDEPAASAGTLLAEAFAEVSASAPDSRRAALQSALDEVVKAVGPLPICRTEVFFDEPERRAPGTGELFALVVDPDTCKSPDLLLARFENRGLRRTVRSDAHVREARDLLGLWRALPDTPGTTIERARTNHAIGPLAAIMLSRHCLEAMAGGDAAEPASGAKLALRHVLGLAEFHLQPRLQAFLAEIDGLRKRLDQRIHDLLADGLPTGDLDALAEGLQTLDQQGDLAALTAKVEAATSEGRIDRDGLARAVDFARGLGSLRWYLAEGPTGGGRARYGLVITGGIGAWAGVHPNNPFHAPTTLDHAGEAAALASGLVHGHLRHVLDGFALLRAARAFLDQSGDDAAPRLGTYADLTADERALCPPLLVVGDGRSLGERGMGGAVRLLRSGLPIKIVALSGFGGDADDGLAVDAFEAHPAGERFDLAMLALLERDAFVLQSSIADPDHFARGVLDAMASDGAAFLHLHAPSPERHGFEPTRLFEQAALAVRSRAVPLFRFDPALPGVFGTRLTIEANPAPDALWWTDEDGTASTPVDWAATERRFEAHLPPLDAAPAGAIDVAGLLALEASERAARSPVTGGSPRRAVDEALLADAEGRLILWRTLQELAGTVTPHTDRVRAMVERELAGTHASALAELEREHAAHVARLRREFAAQAADRLTRGLLEIAGYAADDGTRIDP